MFEKFNLKQPNFLIGLLFAIFSIQIGCKEKAENDQRSYLTPIDSLNFNYTSDSWRGDRSDYLEYRFGRNMFNDSNKTFLYISIDSDNRLHTFNFNTNTHTYSKQICNSKIDAFKIDRSFIYLLYDSIFYVKDYQLNTIDSFVYNPPNISQKHDIDFSVENNSNLFKIKDYFVLMYYVIDEKPDGTNIYRNTDSLFYYFNRDTAFFANKTCPEADTTFQYFRYPVVANDFEYLYHTPRVMNCISKSIELKTLINTSIDTLKNNYLTLKHEDQYEISKLKTYRFSTHYNRDIIASKNYIYLIKEIPSKIYYVNNVRTYDHLLELKKFDKHLNIINTFYIKDKVYSYAFIEGNKLYLFNFNKSKCLKYEI